MAKPIVILYCGSGFIKSLMDKIIHHFSTDALVLPSDYPAARIAEMDPAGIIISGSGSYVHDVRAEQVDPKIYDLGIPILGVCYGMQRMACDLGGEVKKMADAEKEGVLLSFTTPGKDSILYQDFADEAAPVWMSHNCKVTKVPNGFIITGKTKMIDVASIEDRARRFYGVQFHPEHQGRDMTAQAGTIVLWNFLSRVCGLKNNVSKTNNNNNNVAV